MSAIPSHPTASDTAFAFMKRNKLRVFIVLSLSLHGVIGLGWGVPAYIHDQRQKAAEAEKARQLLEMQKTAAAKVDHASDKALALARADVTRMLRATYETLVRDLAEPRQEQLWVSTVDQLAKPIDAVARAMGDTATTEQDLRNLQADLNRQLVETVNKELATNLGKWTQDDVLAQVQEKLIPLLQNHYRAQLGTRVGKPLRDTAGELVKQWRAAKPPSTAPLADGIAQARVTILTPFAETGFNTAFNEHAAGRFADLVTAQMAPNFEARKLQTPTFTAEMRTRLVDLLKTAVARDANFGPATTDRLKDLGTPVEAPEVVAEATKFADGVKPKVGEGLIDVAKDAAADADLLKRAAIKLSSKEDDVAYRVETMAQHAQEGRTVGLDGLSDSTFAQMREEALLRSSEIALMGADGQLTDPSFMDDGSSTQPTTQEAIDPLLEAAMADVWKALRLEFDKLVSGKRTPPQAEQLWGRVQEAMTPDVMAFATALLDPSQSRAQLEVKRTELNTRFAELVRKALEISIEAELSEQLVEGLKGQAGEKIAEAYKEPLKQSIGREMTRAITEGVQQQKRDAVQEFAELKGAVDKAAQTATQTTQGVNQTTNRLGQATKEPASKEPAKQAEAVKREAEKIGGLEQAVKGAADQVKAATAGTTPRAPDTKKKLDDLKAALDGAAAELEKAKTAAAKGDAEAAKEGANKSKDAVAKVGAAAKEAQAAVNNEIDEAARQFAEAARNLVQAGAATQPSADQKPSTQPSDSLAGKVDEKFEEKFHEQAMDPLVNEIIKKFNERLKKEGVVKAGDQSELESKIEDAIAGQVEAKGAAKGAAKGDAKGEAKGDAKGDQKPAAGEAGKPASAGEVAVGAVDTKAVSGVGAAAAGGPSKAIEDKVKGTADKIVDAGVKSATGTLRGQQAIAGAVAGTGGPDANTKELHKNAGDAEKAARAGHGTLLADADGDNSLEGLRSKWLAAAGAAADGQANGAGEGAGEGVGEGTAAGAGAGEGSGPAGAHAGAAGGTGAGSGAGKGAGAPGRGGSGFGPRGLGSGSRALVDRKKLEELAAQSKERGSVTGAGLTREGAAGATSRVDETIEQVVAAVLAPKSPPQMQVKNGEPFQPKFKSIRFATIPFLSKPFKIDGDIEKWKDVPAMELLPERFSGQGLDGLRIEEKQIAKMAWDSTGLYFIINVIDPNKRIDLPSGSNNFWGGDVPEIWIDMLNTKERMRARGTGQQFWCWPFGSASDPSLTGGESVITREQMGYYAMNASGMSRFSRKTDDGYVVEFHIPSARLRDGELVAGKIVGLNINLETGSRVQYYWSSSKAAATYTRPDTWGDLLLGGADGTLEIPAKLTGEGSAAEARETRNAFVIGEPMRLRVTDRDMNLNGRYRDKVAVTVRNPRGEQTVAVLEETTPDSGVFEGAVRTGLAMGEPVPATLSVYEGEAVTVTYVDQARGNGARNADLVYTVRAASPLTTAGQVAAQ